MCLISPSRRRWWLVAVLGSQRGRVPFFVHLWRLSVFRKTPQTNPGEVPLIRKVGRRGLSFGKSERRVVRTMRALSWLLAVIISAATVVHSSADGDTRLPGDRGPPKPAHERVQERRYREAGRRRPSAGTNYVPPPRNARNVRHNFLVWRCIVWFA